MPGNNETIIVCAKYFGYDVGGAEASTINLLKESEKKGANIKVLYFDNVTSFNAQKLKSSLPQTWEVEHIRLFVDWTRFYFLGYLLNRWHLKKLFKDKSNLNSILYTYGIFAPAILSAFEGRKCYFIRDELGLGWNLNNSFGVRRFFKYIYIALDYPFYLIWKSDLLSASKTAKIITNSEFMKREAEKIWNQSIDLIRPHVEIEDLQKKICELKCSSVPKSIVMIGDNPIKGSHIFHKIASHFPQEEFTLVDRKFLEERKVGNLTLLPWQSNSLKVYERAKLILIPSMAHEAYGRVARECFLLKIPVLALKIGGLPEALDYQDKYLVENFREVSEWIRKVKAQLEEETK